MRYAPQLRRWMPSLTQKGLSSASQMIPQNPPIHRPQTQSRRHGTQKYDIGSIAVTFYMTEASPPPPCTRTYTTRQREQKKG